VCEIDPGNGAIRVNESSKLDYESITELILTVSVSDEHDKEPLETSAEITIEITNVVEISYYSISLQPDGETAFIIQRITSGWNESTVTWRTQPSVTMENQVMVDGAILPTQDFPDIDVTQLIGDYVHDRENSHGLLLRFQNENPYKVALLASSDHPIEQLRPKLEVHYSISE
jgi:hypothetical protein